jgi:DNA topoisomerase VI subunit B
MTADLVRQVFSTPRAAEFLEKRALQAQTGQPAHRFGDVVIKELVDNALDAAESVRVQPEVDVRVDVDDRVQRVTVTDNGAGMPAEVIGRILDFNVLVSDKAAYGSPTRGLQGNAWKTLLGIPYALGIGEPVVIEAQGVRHEVAVSIDPGGNVVIRHDKAVSPKTAGTAVTVPLPQVDEIGEIVDGDVVGAAGWAHRFAIFNPHATVIYHGNDGDGDNPEIYKPTVGDTWSKPLPTDTTSPHWYDETALTRLLFAHIGAARNGGRDLPIGEFVRSFAGLSSPSKAKTVKAAAPGVEHLSEFESDTAAVGALLAAMKAEARLPKPTVLGQVPEDHYRDLLDRSFGVKRFWFKRKRLVHRGVPWQLEVAVTEQAGEVVYGVNYSPTFGDPLARTPLASGELSATGADSLLRQADALPDYKNDYLRAAVVHVVCPAAEFLDKGKTGLEVPR